MCLECGCGARTMSPCPECGGRVILIDGETKCVSCGASPEREAAGGHQEGHHHGHSHDSEHTHGEGGTAEGAELLEKLRVLLPHWIEHNAEHAESFCKWAEQARAAGEGHVADHIEEAATRMEEANRDLTGAVAHMGAAERDHGLLDHEHSG